MNDLTNDPDLGVQTTVKALLAAAGLAPSTEELAVLTAQYAAHRQGIDSLYLLPEARYEAPALVFSANPAFADWAD